VAEDEALAALLVNGDVEAFNDRRTDRSRPELFAIDLGGKTLTGVDLSNANLEKADLTGADLSEANLLKANLAGVDGSGMKLVNALALRSRFKEAWLDGADLSGADLTNADFADANLERSAGAAVKLAQARLRGVKATGARWPDADLSEAKMQAAVFVGADLRRADFTEAVLADADLTDANLDGAVGINAKFQNTKLVRARLGAARLTGATFTGADLTGAHLAAADLSRANLAGANLTGANLHGAVLADANLEGATLTGADLGEADLTGLDPAALGLDAKTVAALSASGVEVDTEAVLVVSAPSVATAGGGVVAVWDNPDSPEKRSVRMAAFAKGRWTHAVVPVSHEGVVDRQVAAVGDTVHVVVTRVRPDGAVALAYAVAPDGSLGRGRTIPLGYEPLVTPVLVVAEGRLLYIGVARRGPTLVVHDLSAPEAEAARPVRSDRVATAVGFLGGAPVLACKGGVVVRVSAAGAAKPRRVPDGFPGVTGRALVLGDDLLAVWAVARAGHVPGGMRTALIGPRHAPREEVLSTRGGIVSLAAVGGEANVDVWWAETADDGTGTTVWRAKLPDGMPELLDAPDDVTEVAAGPGVVAAVLRGGVLVVLDPETGRASEPLGGA
jgi:uncharacterized protein YjbI with pentapeptide repeats